ncbi:polysaccharide biosynthesis protein [Anaerococcus hydrogenalis DSM 7454]|uniref:Polysaccharide biosynthesis protein n=1 Tax=Anaerococcus hydrogenalis DSM 7454 TaxID=561177 RepID=B6W7G2_9FIRM|nr:nucleoside-diphosphate sugar epimerase/dehydratase [Anaerococcus hydrogenalis]EEB36705.1 polysaccharide biosynthesis protein [Anaerococcus hydrogenalis DSM 7454]
MNLKKIFNKKTLILLVFDIIIINLAYFFALFLRFDMQFNQIPLEFLNGFRNYAIFNTIITIAIYIFFKLYRMILEYASYNELIKITQAIILSVFIHIIGISLFFIRMPISYFIIGFLIQYMLTVALRFAKKMLIQNKYNAIEKNPEFKRAIIVGAGSAGQTIKEDINKSNRQENIGIKVVAFIDDNPGKKGQYIDDTIIYGDRNSIKELVDKENIDLILVALPSAQEDQKREILQICNETNCEVKVLPGIYQLVSGSVSMSGMKDVQIEDLLGRDPVKIFSNETFEYLNDKVVLVTGGGGSIGSELCRQIAQYGPKLLIIFDIYENNAYEIEQELKRNNKDLKFITLIGSVRDYARVKKVFETYKPDIIFHAAAHKHVPLMEVSPVEAIKNNVRGTYIVALLSLIYNAKRFVLISTDKAVNPTSIMGATKRVCEKIIQGINDIKDKKEFEKLAKIDIQDGDRNIEIDPQELLQGKDPQTEFVAVRFGNVLGSNGSVIPLFKEQIASGGPVTVTHPEIIRYFMTIKEAVKLVLQAGSMASGGEIFVLDMGEPVKIDYLARQLIKLSGYKPDIDMPIIYTGLRPGEKLYEERLMDEELLSDTQIKGISVGRPLEFSRKEFFQKLDKVINQENIDELDIIETINTLISTFIGKGNK